LKPELLGVPVPDVQFRPVATRPLGFFCAQ
jgi:hypothetical protein